MRYGDSEKTNGILTVFLISIILSFMIGFVIGMLVEHFI